METGVEPIEFPSHKHLISSNIKCPLELDKASPDKNLLKQVENVELLFSSMELN